MRTAGRSRQASIYLGDHVHRDLAQDWLDRLREPAAWAAEVAACTDLATSLVAGLRSVLDRKPSSGRDPYGEHECPAG